MKTLRDIRFRGKSVATGEWVYGYFYINTLGTYCIVQSDGTTSEVLSETVCEYIGRKDVNGVDIYTGDLFRYEEDDGYYYMVVIFDVNFDDDPSFHGVNIDNNKEYMDIYGLEIIGNVHDDKEPLPHRQHPQN